MYGVLCRAAWAVGWVAQKCKYQALENAWQWLLSLSPTVLFFQSTFRNATLEHRLDLGYFLPQHSSKALHTLAGSGPLLGYTHFFALRATERELVLPGIPDDANVLISAVVVSLPRKESWEWKGSILDFGVSHVTVQAFSEHGRACALLRSSDNVVLNGTGSLFSCNRGKVRWAPAVIMIRWASSNNENKNQLCVLETHRKE